MSKSFHMPHRYLRSLLRVLLHDQRSLLVLTSHPEDLYIASEYNHALAFVIAIFSTSGPVFVALGFNVS